MKQLSDPPERIVFEIVGGSDRPKGPPGPKGLQARRASRPEGPPGPKGLQAQRASRPKGEGKQGEGEQKQLPHSLHHHPNFYDFFLRAIAPFTGKSY